MTAILPKHGITYVSAPKVACSSLKTLFFDIENQAPFPEFTGNGRVWSVHDVYNSRAFDALPHDEIAAYRRFTVVRDPIARLLSCYSNRVVFYGELSAEHLSPQAIAEGATPDPDLCQFVDRLRLYRLHSPSIYHHSEPLCAYLGRDPGYYEQVYGMDGLADFVALLEGIVGRGLTLERLQTGGPKLTRDALTPGLLRRLEQFYEADYSIWGKHL